MHTTLTDREERFVFEYLKDHSAGAAAGRAGFGERSLSALAAELLGNAAVRMRIRLETQQLLAECGCSAMDLVGERRRAAFFRAGRMFGDDWRLLAMEDMDRETRMALEVSVVLRQENPVVRVRQPCRHKALAALERFHARLERRNEAFWEQVEREAGEAQEADKAHKASGEARGGGEGGVGGGGGSGGAAGVAGDVDAGVEAGGFAEVGAEVRSEAEREGVGVAAGAQGAPKFCEKAQVLSGSAEGAGRVRADGACGFSEKDQVLSGLRGVPCGDGAPQTNWGQSPR